MKKMKIHLQQKLIIQINKFQKNKLNFQNKKKDYLNYWHYINYLKINTKNQIKNIKKCN